MHRFRQIFVALKYRVHLELFYDALKFRIDLEKFYEALTFSSLLSYIRDFILTDYQTMHVISH